MRIDVNIIIINYLVYMILLLSKHPRLIKF